MVVAVLGPLRSELWPPSSSTATSVELGPVEGAGPAAVEGAASAGLLPIDAPGELPARDRGLGIDDGAVPDGTTVWDDVPAVARLDPALLDAVRRAADAAENDGVHLRVNSGWRSASYQARLLDEAVAEYGSREKAERWVATPETSAHVSGDAIDLGPPRAAAWLASHGSAFGLCRVYRNEPWHFELHASARTDGCPTPYPDPTHDPRMR